MKEAEPQRAPGLDFAAYLFTCGLLLSCSPAQSVRVLHGLHVREPSGLSEAVDLADRIAALTEGFPRGYYFLVDQLNHAAVSIAANLAEGNGRFTKADRRNFFTIARGSAQECVPLLEIARRRGFIGDAQHAELRRDLEVIAKMISGLIKGLEKRAG